MNSKMFAKNIKEKREKQGLSTRELAKIVGRSQSHICRLETGTGLTHNPTATLIIQLSQALKTTPNELLGWKSTASGDHESETP